ncbi:unnamed protein product [Phytomonas sp. Hart1]|nr:unnamed protein product [Phytomonas sp. Hart1]|eukprot:CCW68927.1 unnamed protein product [Phytomonas sp. isolate Hart1]
MPPKMPNLRFKPKLVAKSRPQTPQDSSREELTLLQLERLKQEQQQQQHTQPPPLDAPGASPQDPAGPTSRRDPSLSARPPTTANHPETIAAYREKATIGKDALCRQANIASYPDRAETFEANTVYSILTTPGDAFNRVICPVPLQLPEKENEEGQPQAPPATALFDGTAFLREGDNELARAHRANLRFYQKSLSKEAALDVKNEEKDEYEIGKSSTEKEEGPLVYMQLPRFFDNPKFTLANLSPGKVGELKVFKNGRMVIDIAGVYYDVWAEEREEGIHSTVAITQPSSDPLDANCKPSCFEVGSLAMKMVCTPAVEED